MKFWMSELFAVYETRTCAPSVPKKELRISQPTVHTAPSYFSLLLFEYYLYLLGCSSSSCIVTRDGSRGAGEAMALPNGSIFYGKQ